MVEHHPNTEIEAMVEFYKIRLIFNLGIQPWEAVKFNLHSTMGRLTINLPMVDTHG
jgi:hypothetical protein